MCARVRGELLLALGARLGGDARRPRARVFVHVGPLQPGGFVVAGQDQTDGRRVGRHRRFGLRGGRFRGVEPAAHGAPPGFVANALEHGVRRGEHNVADVNLTLRVSSRANRFHPRSIVRAGFEEQTELDV